MRRRNIYELNKCLYHEEKQSLSRARKVLFGDWMAIINIFLDLQWRICIIHLQISFEAIFFKMIGADIKTVVFWKLSITTNIYQPLLAERFIFLFRRNLIKTYVNIICRYICTTDSGGAAHHLQNQIYERVWSLIIRDINNLK